MRTSTVIATSALVLGASQVGTQVAAWQYHHAPVLGLRYTLPRVTLYPPWGLARWTWGLVRVAGSRAFDTRLRLAWTAWGLTLCLGAVGAHRHAHRRRQAVTHWATRRDLRRMGLFARRGVVLGRVGRRVLRDDAPTHVLVVGPTRAGKGENTVIPTLLDWPDSVLVYDPKGELARQTAPWRQQFSAVYQCDPTAMTTHGANLLARIPVGQPAEYGESLALITRLTDPDGTAGQRENATSQHFRELANLLGQGFLLHVLRCGHTTLGAAAHVLHTTPLADLAAQMATQPHPVIQSAAQTLDAMDRVQLQGVLANLKRAFAWYLSPATARLVSRGDVPLATLRTVRHPVTVYYTVPFRQQDALRPVTRLFFHALFDAALTSPFTWTRRLLVLLDEVTTLRTFPLLVDGFDFAAGYGVKLCLLVTSTQRLLGTYGAFHNFVEGSHVRLIFPPNTRQAALTLAPETGEHLVPKTRRTQQTTLAQRPHSTVSTEDTLEPLLTATGLAQLPDGTALLLVGRQAPALVDTIRAYREHPWTQRRAFV